MVGQVLDVTSMSCVLGIGGRQVLDVTSTSCVLGIGGRASIRCDVYVMCLRYRWQGKY